MGTITLAMDPWQTYNRTALLCCTRVGLPAGLNEIVLISGSSNPALRSPEYEPEAWEGAAALRKKLTRSDGDMRDAVKAWLRDPVQAEARYGHISQWRVSGVTNMFHMFNGASSFNQDLSGWDVSGVTDMHGMFYSYGASSFN